MIAWYIEQLIIKVDLSIVLAYIIILLLYTISYKICISLEKGIIKMKRIVMFVTALVLLVTIALPQSDVAHAVEAMKEDPSVVYGGTLSDSQKEEVRRLLDVDPDAVHEFVVTGEDIHHYIGGDINSRMFSSVKITHKEDGHGIVVSIITPDNITQVTSEMYSNALLT